jgi:hypothetical protein
MVLKIEEQLPVGGQDQIDRSQVLMITREVAGPRFS